MFSSNCHDGGAEFLRNGKIKPGTLTKKTCPDVGLSAKRTLTQSEKKKRKLKEDEKKRLREITKKKGVNGRDEEGSRELKPNLCKGEKKSDKKKTRNIRP